MTTQTTPAKHSFQAEVKQVLDIVIHSLYTDKEIFIRELISNASDALEKLRHLQITEKNIFDDSLPLEINISTDDSANTITIQDFGIGMTDQELVENLGTIAHSGSKAFINALKEGGSSNDNLIGQFGVGFYSAFMVAESVDVYSHSWQPDSSGYHWHCDGSSEYSIESSEGQRRGSKIIIKLKDEYKEFSQKTRVEAILKHYSNFVQFPINFNGERLNTVEALWLKNKNDISDDDYKEFYKFQANAYDEPLSWLHFSADAPLSINALLFIPSDNQELLGLQRLEPGVALHCRKILIDSHPENLLPEWLRFLRGVVDSADLPLNISRESMQDSALIQKLNKVLTRRFLKTITEMANKDPEKFNTFWKTFGIFLKEGVANDFTHREQLSKLLRFESSLTESGKLTTFEDYISRMKPDQKEIYFLSAPSRASIETSPYLETFKANNIEVLFLFDSVDEFVMSHLNEFDGKKLTSADSNDITLDKVDSTSSEEPLDASTATELCTWIKESLGEKKVTDVATSSRLVDSPAIALNADKMMSTHMHRIMKAMNKDAAELPTSVRLEINPSHPLIKNLNTLRSTNKDLAQLIAQQLLDNTLIAAGLLEDPRTMVSRMNQLLENLSKG